MPDAVNKAGFSCWSYWQGSINRNSGDYANLINLANTLSGDPSRGIDPDQVYISGLSSGAAFAAQTGCVAPDVFAGVAPSAGPTIGTSSGGALNTCEVVSPATFKSRCNSYAGSSYQSHFATQIAVVAHGTADTTVDTCYNQQNANGYANLYNVSQLSGTNTVSEGAGHTAQETLWQDDRVAMLWLDGLDHSWSGGAGASGSYVAGTSINFASYLADRFINQNLRVDRNQGPVVSGLGAIEGSGGLIISGNAVDAEGSVSNVEITINLLDSGSPTLIQTINVNVDPGTGDFSAQSNALNDGLYEVSAQATDNENALGDAESMTIRVGPPPPNTAPSLSDISVSVSGQCADVSGTVIDVNQDLASVSVSVSSNTVTATVTGNQYQASLCNLPGGSNTALVNAVDAQNLSSTDSISFTIDAGETGDYNYHIAQGHITWGSGYANCYLEFGTARFTMREYASGSGQCNWVADGAPACAGPNQSCSSGGGGGGGSDADGDGIDDSVDNCPNDANSNQLDTDNDGIGDVCDSTPGGGSGGSCTETTASNYAHVSAGRANLSGFYQVYAAGSGNYMGWYNTYTITTLAETSTGYYEVGSCP